MTILVHVWILHSHSWFMKFALIPCSFMISQNNKRPLVWTDVNLSELHFLCECSLVIIYWINYVIHHVLRYCHFFFFFKGFAGLKSVLVLISFQMRISSFYTSLMTENILEQIRSELEWRTLWFRNVSDQEYLSFSGVTGYLDAYQEAFCWIWQHLLYAKKSCRVYMRTSSVWPSSVSFETILDLKQKENYEISHK